MSTSSSENWRREVVPAVIALAMLVAAEVFLRVVHNTHLISKPVKMGSAYLDKKREVFQGEFLPRANDEGVIILGSSVADTDLSPTEIRRTLEPITGGKYSMWNGALYGCRLDDAVPMMKWYYKQWKYKRMIFGIETGVLRPYRMPDVQERLASNDFEMWLRDHSYLFLYRAQIRRWKPSDKDNQVAWESEITRDGWHRSPTWNIGITPEVQVRNFVNELLKWKIHDEQMDDIAQWCKENDIDLTWVILPVRPDVASVLPPTWTIPEIQARTHQVADKYGNRVLDMSGMRVTTEDFFDAGHLHCASAAQLSRILGDRLGMMLKEGKRSYEELGPIFDEKHVSDAALPTAQVASR